MTAALPSSLIERSNWRSLCDRASAAVALPATVAPSAVTKLYAALEGLAIEKHAAQLLTCNPETLADMLALCAFFKRWDAGSTMYRESARAVEQALSAHHLAGVEVGTHYALAISRYAQYLGTPLLGSEFGYASQRLAFQTPFWSVRPRALSDRSDYRRALYAAELPGHDDLDSIRQTYDFELIDTLRSGDAEALRWLLIVWHGESLIERHILPAAMTLLKDGKGDPILDDLVSANLQARTGKEIK